MKNHKNLIRLIVVTAALVACGVFAFKYLRTYKNKELTDQMEQVQDENVAICVRTPGFVMHKS